MQAEPAVALALALVVVAVGVPVAAAEWELVPGRVAGQPDGDGAAAEPVGLDLILALRSGWPHPSEARPE